MRVLGRLLGSNIGELVDRIAGMATPGSAAPDVQERILCARCVCVSNSYVRMCMCSSGRILCKMRWFALNFNLFLSVIPLQIALNFNLFLSVIPPADCSPP